MNLRIIFLTVASLGLAMMMVCPGASAQVPTAQSGGSGENAPPPPAKAAPAKPAPAAKASSRKSKKVADKNPAAAANSSAEPDKVLYDRSMADLKGGRYTEGRLALQTLINTYPDSEYLAKAKLAVADSYYKEGGTSNMTQAIQEYKDFITFFPFLDEAAYAQMQVAKAHYEMMEKSDRDRTQSEAAEDEFQAFLLKYPQSPLAGKAEQYLRDVQEVLADGDYKIAHYYYTKQDFRAAGARLVELTGRYPLYSQNDEALWMLGSIYERAKLVSKNEDEKNHWGDVAARCFAMIVRDYPLSKLAPASKEKLKSMGKPVPMADPQALARMQKQQLYEKEHTQTALVRLPMMMIKGSPDVSSAAHVGTPQMNPPNDAVSATDVLRPGANGPSFNVAGGSAGGGAASGSENNSEVVTPEDATTVPVGTNEAQTGVGVQIIAPADDNSRPRTDVNPGDPTTPAATNPDAGAGTTPAPAVANPPVDTTGSNTTVAPASSPNAAGTTGATDANAPGSTPAPAGGTAQGSSDAAAGQSTDATKATTDDSGGESTSKKKKGLRKIIPW
jgi:outer membrane protein assembly factor BamD